MVRLCWVWYVIIALRKHARSDYVKRAMLSSSLDNTHDRTTSGAACSHGPWAAPIVRLRRVWHAIVAVGQYTWWSDVRRVMQSSPLDSIRGQTTLGVAYHHGPWPAHTVTCGSPLSPLDNIHRVGQHRAWHAILTLEQHTPSHDIDHDMISYPMDCTHVRTTFAVAMLSSPLGSTHD